MITTGKQVLFQKEWTGIGERGFRDFLLIPAIFFGAVSPGFYVSSILFGFTAGLWISLIMNFIGYGLTHLFYLGRMERFWRAMFNWKTSWISRGFIFNALFSAFGLLYALSASFDSVPYLNSPPAKSALMILGILSAVLFAAYPGFMLSIVKAIPFWRSFLEPLIFFLQGMMGGTALHIFISRFYVSGLPGENVLVMLNFLFVLIVLLLLMAALITKALHGSTEKRSVEFLVTGEFSPVFLGGAVVIGLAVPLLMLAAAIFSPYSITGYRGYYCIAMLMELAGIYLGKYSILRAGAYTPVV